MDVGRAEVYAAELMAFDGTDLEEVVSFDLVSAAITAVTGSEWWAGADVTLRSARSDARSSNTRCETGDGADVTISIARPQCTIATAAHEVAHALAGVVAGHGPMFRRAHLDVISIMTNRPDHPRRGGLHVRQLADAYASSGLDIGARAWPAPPEEPDQGAAIAL